MGHGVDLPHSPFGIAVSAGVQSWCRAESRSVALRGSGAGLLEARQQCCCVRKVPVVTRAKESEPGSAGRVNTGFFCAP